MDEFGGIAVDDPRTDEFGGVAVAEEPKPPLKIKLSPYQKARLDGMEPVSGPFGPANPQEVLALPQILKAPAAAIENTGIMQSLEEVGADFLNRTGINPSAQPSQTLISDKVSQVPPSPLEQAFPNVTKGIEDALKKFVTPGTAVLTPLASTKALQAGFELQMASGVPESVQALAQAKTPKEIGEAGTQLVAGILATVHGLKGKPKADLSTDAAVEPIKPLASATAEALKTQLETEDLSAIQQKAAEVLPDVRTPAGESLQEVPATTASKEVGARSGETSQTQAEVAPAPKPYAQRMAEAFEEEMKRSNERAARKLSGQALKPTTNLPSLIKAVGRPEVERLVGEWDQNAELHPSGKSIVTLSDPRNQTGRTKASITDFLSWYEEQKSPLVEAIPEGALFQGVRPGNVEGSQGKSSYLTDDLNLAGYFSSREGEAGIGRIDVYDPKSLPPLGDMLEKEKSKSGSSVYSYADLKTVKPSGSLVREGDKWIYKQAPPSGESGEAKPVEAPVSAATALPATTDEAPQAIAEIGTAKPVEQVGSVTPEVTEQVQKEVPTPSDASPTQSDRLREVIALLRQRESQPSTLKESVDLEGSRLKSLTEKMESGQALTTAERKRYQSLRDKATETKPQEDVAGVQAGTPTSQPDKGIAASVRKKWTSATAPEGSEAGFINIDPIREMVDKATPYVRGAFLWARQAAVEAGHIAKTTDYRRSVLRWSGKMQRSFSEAASAQKDILSRVKDPDKRQGIINWIQTGGDYAVLAQRKAATESWTDPATGKPHPKKYSLIKGYDAALDLTPEEIAVAHEVKAAYDDLLNRGLHYGIIKSFKDNYVTQVWDLGRTQVTGGSRTLRDRFKFSKASTFPSYFDGEQAGFVPKDKDISKVLPVYIHEMNAVIAARQLAEDLSKGTASDGRPLVQMKGSGHVVDGPKGQAVLVSPKTITEGARDYKTIENQPALSDWVWKGKDTSGNPIFLKADMALHPEAYSSLKKVLGKSAIQEWYQSQGSAMAQIPKAIAQALDAANAGTKRTMLGFFAPFHQVQEGTHGLGHKTNPFFNIPKVDPINDAGQSDAVSHGLMMLPDRVSAQQFMDGFKVSGLVSHIPAIGPAADFYSNYLFHQYIPGLKYKTYENILGRNQKVYSRELSSGEVSPEDVKILSAEQTNAAYGHLNYADLARNPTVMHLMRLGLLAPDFFEARARFTAQAAKGITGAKVGREQLVALATLAIGQAALAYTAAKTTGGEWYWKHPFEFHTGSRRYTLRSVPEDISSLLNNTRVFVHSRLSPIIGKGTLQYLSGVDWRGQKASAAQTTKELAQQPIPISVRGFFGLGNQSLSVWEQMAGAAGLRISRYSYVSETFKLASDWMKKSEDPKVQARYQTLQKTTYPESDYKPLRDALVLNDNKKARLEYGKLLKTKTSSQISVAMHVRRPFTGSHQMDEDFFDSLSEDQKLIFTKAVQEREDLYERFLAMKDGAGQQPEDVLQP